MRFTVVLTEVLGPPVPLVQVRVKTVFWLMTPVMVEPSMPRLAKLRPPPIIVHPVAFVAFQWRLVVSPLRTKFGSG